MRLNDIVDELCRYDGRYKRALVDEALARQEAVTPLLLELLEKVLAHPERYAGDDSFFGHLYAALLLGHFREERAHRIFIDLFGLPGDLPLTLFGDSAFEDLPGLLLNTSGGDLDAIKAFIRNSDVNAGCRSSAMHSISYAVVTGDLERSEAIAYFQEFLRKPEDETQALLIDQAAACLLDLYPEESMDLIDRAYALGRIDPTFVSRDDFDRQLAQGREDTLGELAAMWLRHNPADFHKRMSWWACFEQQDTTPAAVKSASSDRKIAQQHKNKKKAKRKMAKASRRKTRKSRKK